MDSAFLWNAGKIWVTSACEKQVPDELLGGKQGLQGLWEAFHLTERLELTGWGHPVQDSKLSSACGYPAIKLSAQATGHVLLA